MASVSVKNNSMLYKSNIQSHYQKTEKKNMHLKSFSLSNKSPKEVIRLPLMLCRVSLFHSTEFAGLFQSIEFHGCYTYY